MKETLLSSEQIAEVNALLKDNYDVLLAAFVDQYHHGFCHGIGVGIKWSVCIGVLSGVSVIAVEELAKRVWKKFKKSRYIVKN